MMHPDDYGFTYATDADWDREAAREIGADDPSRAWVLTDRDVWHRNPFYTGPAVPHPEDDREDGPEGDLPGGRAPMARPARTWNDWAEGGDEIPF